MQTLVQRLFLAAAVLILPGSAAATTILGDAVSLERLVEGGGSLLVGDKTFSEFTYSTTGLDMPTAGEVNVIPILDDDGNLGIRFQGLFQDQVGDGGSDALISFLVTAPDALITDAHLMANPVLLGEMGSIGVVETFDAGPPSLTVFAETGVEKTMDWRLFDEPLESVRVTKDIFAHATGELSVQMSFIDQTFSQIPEPGTVLLLGLGLSGLALAGRPRFN